MIAAAVEMRISLLEFDLLGRFVEDDGEAFPTAVTKCSGAAEVGAAGGVSWVSGGIVRTLPCGGILSGTLLAEPLLGGSVSVGTFPGVTGLGASGIDLTGLGEAGLVETALVSGDGSGALGRGT